jgi:predicted alpha/beta superfamily hydrolase
MAHTSTSTEREHAPDRTWTGRGARVIADTDVFDLRSAAIDDTLTITVARPPLYDPSRSALPTLYVLDPTATFDTVTALTRTLSMLAYGSFPQTLVVGVGYPGDDVADLRRLRFRDLTPTVAAMPASLGQELEAGLATGGGGRFLDALTDEIIPFVEQRYRSDPSRRTLVGWSAAGLFGLWAMFRRPDVFRHDLIVSPSIWWDDRLLLHEEETFARDHADLPVGLFLAVGANEETSLADTWPTTSDDQIVDTAMVTNLLTLAERLRSRGYPGLHLDTAVLSGEHHLTAFHAAVAQGLVRLLAPAAPDVPARD